MINFNNGVTNILGTPGILTLDNISQLPLASNVAVGTIAIYTFDGNKVMVQSDGSTWLNLGGGGGSTPGIDSVLAVNQWLTANRTINIDGYAFYVEDNSTGSQLLQLLPDYQYIGSTASLFLQSGGNPLINTYYAGNLIGIYFDYNNSNLLYGQENYQIQIDYGNALMRTYTDGNKFGYFFNNEYAHFGDYDGEKYQLKIYKSNEIMTYVGGLYSGLSFVDSVFRFGDFDGAQNGTSITIDDLNQQQIFNTNKLQFFGAALQANTAGGSSGKHLVINLNGAQYKIALLNP